MWALVQVLFNLVMVVVGITLWLRSRRPPQDDPRLSRGLQLLQTKITVLEDLSDRTENQAKQLTQMLDQKARLLQNKVIEAEQQVLKIDHSMHKSLEVAEIFQDKIPHNEIMERQRTVEYVRAARMAHSGLQVDEIAKSVHLPREQVELIAKFNREQLMFDESQLPGWAKEVPTERIEDNPSFALTEIDFVGGLEKPFAENVSKIQADFKEAVQNVRTQQQNAPATSIMETRMGESLQPAVMSIKATAQTLKERLVASAEELLRSQGQHPVPGAPLPKTPLASAITSTAPASNPAPKSVVKMDLNQPPLVRKVVFPRIEK